jgi:hypothetical protein
MTTATWPVQAENWLDRRGKAAWVIATVLAFIVFWPLGLAILGYLAYTRKMFRGGCGRRMHHVRHAFRSSGNTAFDAYKAETIRRLEEDQDAFEAFLQRLREAKDKSEFDQFMDERSRRAADSPDSNASA